MSRFWSLAAATLMLACSSDSVRVAPAGEGPIYAGFAKRTLLDAGNFDTLFETYEDRYPVRTITRPDGTTTTVVGNGSFDGCPDAPRGPESGRPECREPFADRNGDGWFQGAFLAGFGNSRAAQTVHDPIEVVAWSVRAGDRILASATVDLIGYFFAEVAQIEDLLRDRGVAFDALVVSSTHNHEAPDAMGQWGPNASGNFELPLTTGAHAGWRAHIRRQVADAVEAAINAMAPTELCATEASSARNPIVAAFPDRITETMREAGAELLFPDSTGTRRFQIDGLENDWRDPFIPNHRLATLQARTPDGAVVGTVVNIHSHPEVLWAGNTAATADYPGYVRERLEQLFPGSVGIDVSGSVGGILGPHEVPVWQRDANGERMTIRDPDTGAEAPVVAPNASFAKARSLGYDYAEAAAATLNDGAACASTGQLRIAQHTFRMPVQNPLFLFGAFVGLFDRPVFAPDGTAVDAVRADVVKALGPLREDPLGLVETRATAADLRLDDTNTRLRLISAPGEMFPETMHGLPDDLEDPALQNFYWPQGRALHADPYTLQYTLADLFAFAPDNDTRVIPFLFGLGDDALGYLVPNADFARINGLLQDFPEDHGTEDGNSVGPLNEATMRRIYTQLAAALDLAPR